MSKRNLDSILDSKNYSEVLMRINEDFYSKLRGTLIDSLNYRGENGLPYIFWDTLSIPQELATTLRETAFKVFDILSIGVKPLKETDSLMYMDPNLLSSDFEPWLMVDNLPLGDVRIDFAINPEAFTRSIEEGIGVNISDLKVIGWDSETTDFFWETYSGTALIAQEFDRTSINLTGKDYGQRHGQCYYEYLKKIATLKGINLNKEKLVLSYPGDPDLNFVNKTNLSILDRIGFYQSANRSTLTNPNLVEFLYFQDLVLDTQDFVPGVFSGQSLMDGGKEMLKLIHSFYPSRTLMNDINTSCIDQDEALLDTSMLFSRVWDMLLKNVIDNQLTLIPGVENAAINSTSFYAYLWGCAMNNTFDNATNELIRQLFLPTYTSDEKASFEGNWDHTTIIETPILPIEGSGSYVYTVNGSEYDVHFNSHTIDNQPNFQQWYDEAEKTYQKHQQLPQLEFDDATLNLVFSVWISNGTPCGILCRGHKDGEKEILDDYNQIWIPLTVQE